MNWKIVVICILIAAVVLSPMVIGQGYDDAFEVWEHRYPDYNEIYDLDGSGDITSNDVSIAYIEGLE